VLLLDWLRPLGRARLGGKIILKLILEKKDGVIWTRLNWLRIRASGGLL
jgi:hypothetical protein